MKILYIEDEPDFRLLMGFRFKDWGFEYDCIDPKDYESHEGYDAIIVDYHMDPSGIEMARRLRDEGYDNPIIVFSAISPHRIIVEFMDAGVKDFEIIEKGRSVVLHELLEWINND